MVTASGLHNIMMGAARKASRSLNRDFGEVEHLQVSKKGPADFVSRADKQAEEVLVEELSISRPGYGFLLEEGGEIKGTDPHTVSLLIHWTALPIICIQFRIFAYPLLWSARAN